MKQKTREKQAQRNQNEVPMAFKTSMTPLSSSLRPALMTGQHATLMTKIRPISTNKRPGKQKH